MRLATVNVCYYSSPINLYYKDGSIYQGEFKENMMNGKGRKINGDGDYYEGDWIDNKYHGKVSYIVYSYRENM